MRDAIDRAAGTAAHHLLDWMSRRADPARRPWIAAMQAELDVIEGGVAQLAWAVGGLRLIWSAGRRPVEQHATRRRSLGRAIGTLATSILVLSFFVLPVFGKIAVVAWHAYRPAPTAVTPTPGMIPMTEGALQMQMTPRSGRGPTPAELARVARLVRQAMGAAARYRDLTVARSDGYATAPGLFVATQGAHYFNAQYDDDAASGTFNPAHPPFLVYNTVQGKTVLTGLMYEMPADATPRQLAAIFPPSLASWHQHINLCVVGGPGVLDWQKILPIHDPHACRARQNAYFFARTTWLIHLWLRQPLGPSLFAMDRPRS